MEIAQQMAVGLGMRLGNDVFVLLRDHTSRALHRCKAMRAMCAT